MTKTEIVAYFGSQRRAAEALGIRQASISEWPENDVPGHWQIIIERISQGKIRVSPNAYKDVMTRVRAITRGVIQLTKDEVKERARKFCPQQVQP